MSVFPYMSFDYKYTCPIMEGALPRIKYEVGYKTILMPIIIILIPIRKVQNDFDKAENWFKSAEEELIKNYRKLKLAESHANERSII